MVPCRLSGGGCLAGYELVDVDRLLEELDDGRVELRSGMVAKLRPGGLDGDRRPVDAVRRHRAECVGDGDDPRPERDVQPDESVRVAGAVEPLVVVSNDPG